MNAKKQNITIKVAQALNLSISNLKNRGFVEEAKILEKIFTNIDDGIPFYDEVQKENKRLWEETKTHKLACDMSNIWRKPSITISANALEKFGIKLKIKKIKKSVEV